MASRQTAKKALIILQKVGKVHTGIFITFEGPDGSGKSTQMEFLAGLLERAGVDVVKLREPGGTPLGEALREILLDTSYTGMDERAELLLYEAARAELTHEVIKPALAAGKVVLSDRFSDSTCAYQGAGRGLDLNMIGALNEFATHGIEPDITFVLGQGSAAANATRLNARETLDRIELETAEFHKSVTAYFETLPAVAPERVHFINTSNARSDAAREVLEILQVRFAQINLEALDIDAELAAFDARHAN